MGRRGRLVGQRCGIGGHPISHRLMHDPQVAGDAPQVHAVYVGADGLLAQSHGVALRLGLGRVFALAEDAQIALAPRWVASDLELAVGVLAVWASKLFHWMGPGSASMHSCANRPAAMLGGIPPPARR